MIGWLYSVNTTWYIMGMLLTCPIISWSCYQWLDSFYGKQVLCFNYDIHMRKENLDIWLCTSKIRAFISVSLTPAARLMSINRSSLYLWTLTCLVNAFYVQHVRFNWDFSWFPETASLICLATWSAVATLYCATCCYHGWPSIAIVIK